MSFLINSFWVSDPEGTSTVLWNGTDQTTNYHWLPNGTTNKTATNTNTNNNSSIRSDVGFSSGKKYWEASFSVATSPSDAYIGIDLSSGGIDDFDDTYLWVINGTVYSTGGTESGTPGSFTTGDVLMFALDMDNKLFYIGKNGTWLNSGDPVGGTGYVFSAFSSGSWKATLRRNNNSTSSFTCTLATGLSYAPPSGYLAL